MLRASKNSKLVMVPICHKLKYIQCIGTNSNFCFDSRIHHHFQVHDKYDEIGNNIHPTTGQCKTYREFSEGFLVGVFS